MANVKSKKAQDLLKQDHVQAKVAERAYYISESEGFPVGRELIHWVQAEEHVLAELLGEISSAVLAAVRKMGPPKVVTKKSANGKPSSPRNGESPSPPAAASRTSLAKTASKPAAPKTAAPKKAAPKVKPATKAPSKKK